MGTIAKYMRNILWSRAIPHISLWRVLVVLAGVMWFELESCPVFSDLDIKERHVRVWVEPCVHK